MSHYRVAGLSRFLKLGECVGVDVGDRIQMGEVVRIDEASATLKPFDARSDAAIGARAFRAETLSLSPHPGWKGRVIDALGRPIDGAGELPAGDRPAPLDAPPPPPLRRGRVHAPLRTGVRVVDLFTPLCIGQRIGHIRRLRRRQVVASGDAGPGDPDRHCRHRARWRTGPRGEGIYSGHNGGKQRPRGHRRLDRRRKPDDAPTRSEDGDGGRRIFPRFGRIRCC